MIVLFYRVQHASSLPPQVSTGLFLCRPVSQEDTVKWLCTLTVFRRGSELLLSVGVSIIH
jgi:hypothetical protein